MKKTILFHILIFSSIIIIAQTQHITDSLYQKLHQEVNIVNQSSGRSDVVWERIPVADSIDIKSFTIFNNELYLGAMFGGAYKYFEEQWVFIGPPYKSVFSFEQYNSTELLICTSSGFFLWDNNTLALLPGEYYSYVNKIDDYFLGYYSYENLHRSTDSCYTWETVLDLSGTEGIRGVTHTSTDSIFIGTTKYTGDGGGVYLSADAGITWNHIGLTDHFIESMGVDNNNQVYAGNNGHYETGQGGLYKYNYNNTLWDTIFYFPYITSLIFNSENYMFTGFSLSGAEDWGGVMHTEDNGISWILDTTGIGNTWVHDIQIDNNGFLYAMAGYPTMRLYKTNLPVSINKKYIDKDNDFYFYPNPVTNNINIIINNGLSLQNISVSIFNIYGNFICSYEINKNIMEKQVTINTSNLEQGLYICHIQINNKKSNIKFIKR